MYGGSNVQSYCTNNALSFKYEDYHFFSKCPSGIKNYNDFLLFTVLCSVNFVRIFINQYFVDEFPAKLRYAYLQYYTCNNARRQVIGERVILECRRLLTDTNIESIVKEYMAACEVDVDSATLKRLQKALKDVEIDDGLLDEIDDGLTDSVSSRLVEVGSPESTIQLSNLRLCGWLFEFRYAKSSTRNSHAERCIYLVLS